MSKLKVVGVTCGIGSMLLGARQAGFKVLGNIEWRKYYHAKDADGHATFHENFKNAFMVHDIEELNDELFDKIYEADLAMGHPECGNFSQLNQTNRERVTDAADIPLFVDLIAQIRPRFFVMDDLPKSFMAFPMAEYVKRLPDYDLFPEWISNYHYGNIQKNRRRMFMIGALKDEEFAFVPGEFEHNVTVADVIGDLYGKEGKGIPNHERHVLKVNAAKGQHLNARDHRATWEELKRYWKDKKGGNVVTYYAADGTIKTRPGTYKGHWDAHAHVMDGGSPAIHAKRGLPYTVRERARIQGFPDDFVFYGTKLDKYGRWNHDQNLHMVKQTGKAMPIQFNNYVARQVKAHINNRGFRTTERRVIKPDIHVDSAKMEYCAKHDYANQEKACHYCWLHNTCELRKAKRGS